MQHWTTKILIFLLFLLVLVSAYNYFHKPFLKNAQLDQSQVVASPTPTTSKTPKKELSILEKLAQLIAVPLDLNDVDRNGSASANMLGFIRDKDPGFIVYFGDKVSTTSAVATTAQIRTFFDETRYAPLIAVDHEGGTVQRLDGDGFTRLDSWQKVVTTYSAAQQKAVYNQSARELASVGINIVFAPVIDLASGSAFLKTRVANDLDQTFAATSNFIYSFSQMGIMPVVKHFPGIGSINKDPHQAVSTISLGKQDTEIFSKVLNKFANIGVMTTHVRLQDKLSGQVCSLSEECLGKFAEFFPNVLLFSDDLLMKSALSQAGSTQEKDVSQVAVEAIVAGNNVLVFGKGIDSTTLEKVIYALQKEYNDSESFRKKVDLSLQKILKLKK